MALSGVSFFGGIRMIYIGIDVAKSTHYAAVMNSDGVVLTEPFAFANDAPGFASLLGKVSGYPKDDLLFGLESTGIYSENLICFLYESGYQIAVINPIQTASLRKTNIRKTKTDKVDTFLIIKSLMVNSYRLYSAQDAQSMKLKSLCRFRQNLKKSKARLKIQLAGFVNLLFPELASFFKSGIHINTCYELLKRYSSPSEIAALRLSSLSNLLSKASHGRFGRSSAEALKSLAKTSVGVKNPYISIQIAQTIQQIELLEQQIDEIEKVIRDTVDQMDSVLMTVPGIGAVDAAMILGEIGCIDRFDKPCKLLAYAGLDPTVNQSGKFKARSTKMSKRGSKTLRFALINAAWQLTLNDSVFFDYYSLKRSQGLDHYGALGHVAHKLVRVIFKLLKSNSPFIHDRLQNV